MKKLINKIITVLLVVVLLAGLSLLLYPTVSNYYHSYLQSQVIVEYASQVDEMESEVYRQLWEAAEAYNAALLERSSEFSLPRELEEQYYTMLDATGQGIIGYIEIPSINVTLPIGHGTEEDVLKDSVGHLEWSSLPVGGESTHCVLSGHRGLPSSELFTNIDHLENGDVFYIHVLGQTLTYMVDHIAVVEPDDFTFLGVEQGEDLVTLITCTPYGINSHRLLVRGARVEEAETETSVSAPENNKTPTVDLMVVIPVALVILAAAVVLFLIIDSGKKKKNRKGNGDNNAEK